MPWLNPYYGQGYNTHNKEGQVSLFDDLTARFPQFIVKEIIGQSYLGVPIPMYRVGNPTGGKFLFDGAIHGCSDVSTMIHHLFLKWLLEAHKRVVEGSSDPWDVRAYNIIQKKCLLCIPIFNIDRSTRKNANGGFWPAGVDLNRNFAYNWSSSGTTDPNNDYYHGTSPASELETQAVKGVFEREVPEIYVNFHNWGGMVFRSCNANSAQSAFAQTLANNYATVRTQLGITDTVYSYVSGSLSAGFATADAARVTGVKASFLIEVCRTNTDETTKPSGVTESPWPPLRYTTDPTFTRTTGAVVSGFYARIKPILIAFAEAVTDGSPINPQKYLFKQWQDGDTSPTKTINV